jgi:hypothetical protein
LKFENIDKQTLSFSNSPLPSSLSALPFTRDFSLLFQNWLHFGLPAETYHAHMPPVVAMTVWHANVF